jgi:hypothetical protein
MPVLGVVGAAIAADMMPIQSVTVGAGGSSFIDFTNIPNTFKHLQIRGIAKTSASYESDGFNMTFNSSTGNLYWMHFMTADGGNGISPSSALTQPTLYITARVPGDTTNASDFGAFVVSILDYASTDQKKTMRSLSGFSPNNTNNVAKVALASGAFDSTAAVSSIRISANSGVLKQFSRFNLYGLRG